jgi:hypothetical protein
MQSRSEMIPRLLQAIEHIKLGVTKIKVIVLEATDEEESPGTDIFVHAAAVEEGEQAIQTNVNTIVDAKPKVKPTKQEQILEARCLAKAWAKSLETEKNQPNPK